MNKILTKKKITILASLVILAFVCVLLFFIVNPATRQLSALVPGLTYENLSENKTGISITITNGYKMTDVQNSDILELMSTLNDIKISSYEVSKNYSEFGEATNIVSLCFDSDLDSFTDHTTKVVFNENYTMVFVDDGVKPSYIYEVKETEKVKDIIDIGDLPYDELSLDFYKMLEFYDIKSQGIKEVKFTIDMANMPKLEEIPISEQFEPREIYYMKGNGLNVYSDEWNDVYLTSLYFDRENSKSDKGYIGFNFQVENKVSDNACILSNYWYNEENKTFSSGNLGKRDVDVEDGDVVYSDIIDVIGYGSGGGITFSMYSGDYEKLQQQMNFKTDFCEMVLEKIKFKLN